VNDEASKNCLSDEIERLVLGSLRIRVRMATHTVTLSQVTVTLTL
jgi:hypothetical protein